MIQNFYCGAPIKAFQDSTLSFPCVFSCSLTPMTSLAYNRAALCDQLYLAGLWQLFSSSCPHIDELMCSFSFSFEPTAWQGESPPGFNDLLYRRVNSTTDWWINHTHTEGEIELWLKVYFDQVTGKAICTVLFFHIFVLLVVYLLIAWSRPSPPPFHDCDVQKEVNDALYVVRNKTETCDDGSPFGRKIDSDILISSCNGFKTPIIFLTKLILIFETVTQQRNVVMLCNTTALFCWLFCLKGFERVKTEQMLLFSFFQSPADYFIHLIVFF